MNKQTDTKPKSIWVLYSTGELREKRIIRVGRKYIFVHNDGKEGYYRFYKETLCCVEDSALVAYLSKEAYEVRDIMPKLKRLLVYLTDAEKVELYNNLKKRKDERKN